MSWASMIAGYVQHDLCEEALATLKEMQHCNAGSKAMRQRLPIHARVYMSGSSDDISIWNTLVYLYARCGRSEEAFFFVTSLSSSYGTSQQHGLSSACFTN